VDDPTYDASTAAANDPARRLDAPQPRGAMNNKALTRLLAVEVLLTDPEALGNDALEGDLYILRDQLRAAYLSQANLPEPKGTSQSAR
jgi:hypothetical protein